MDHPDDGALTPAAGARRHDAVRKAGQTSTGQASAAGAAAAANAAQHPTLTHSSGAATRSGDGSPDGHAPSRKRRKRKRGRKVFARDETRHEAVPPQSAPIAQFESPPSPVPPQAGQDARRDAPPPPQVPAQRVYSARDVPVYAALDLGTNNCRLLVAIPTRPGHFRVVDAFSRIVRLGEGLSASGRLSDAAMDRAVEALKVCAEKLSLRRIGRARLVATEACRAASNGEAFLARVRRETGLSLEIIDRETEARLAVSGCGSLVDPDTRGVVLFDIGGGSSEIALIDLTGRRSSRLASHIVAWTSLPVGVVSLAEKFGGREVSRESFGAMQAYVSDLLLRFQHRDRLAAIATGPGFHLLGTSGTVTTLAGVHLGLERYDRRKVDGLWLGDDDVDRVTGTLLGWSFEDRMANACIGADRADLVLAGCAILEAIRVVWPAKRLRVADRGLREGMLSELMANDGAWRRVERQPLR